MKLLYSRTSRDFRARFGENLEEISRHMMDGVAQPLQGFPIGLLLQVVRMSNNDFDGETDR